MLRNAKERAIQQALKPFASLLAQASLNDIDRLAALVGRVAMRRQEKNIVQAIRKQWGEGTPGSQLIARAFTQTEQRCRTRIIWNLMNIGPWGISGARRQEFFNRRGFWPPTAVLISPTMRCNLNCEGCYAGNYSRADDLSHDTLDRLLAECNDIGTHMVVILGGELFIRDDLWDLFERYPEFLFMVFTNGTLIDEKIAKRVVIETHILIRTHCVVS